MYIDECGNPGLETSENPNHRFLSLTGVIIDLNYVSQIIHPQIEDLKKKYFNYHPDEPVIFHRKEMVNHLGVFQLLKDEKTRIKFDEELLKLLKDWQYKVITICIDKKSHKDTYSTWRYDPYHYCLAVMLERYFFFLKENQDYGDVMAESRGKKEDSRLKKSYFGLWENGTEFISEKEFQKYLTSKELKVKPKQNNIAGLQIADLLAHPSRKEILIENGFENDLADFAKIVVQILKDKYYSRSGNISGYGKKFIA